MSTEIDRSIERAFRNLGSDESRRSYRLVWKRWMTWCGQHSIDILAAKPGHVEDHLEWMRTTEGCKRPTLSHALAALRSLYAYLVRDEVCTTNPAREVKAPRFDAKPKVPWLSEEGIERLFLSIPEPDSWKGRRTRVCLSLLFGLGWRRAEVARLRIGDFYSDAGPPPTWTVRGVVKRGKTIQVAVPDWVREELVSWLKFNNQLEGGDYPILPRKPGSRDSVSPVMVYKIVANAAAAAGVKINPHGLRRSNITLAGERGVSAKARQLAVGHSSAVTTERYDMARDATKSAPGQVFADLVRKR